MDEGGGRGLEGLPSATRRVQGSRKDRTCDTKTRDFYNLFMKRED